MSHLFQIRDVFQNRNVILSSQRIYQNLSVVMENLFSRAKELNLKSFNYLCKIIVRFLFVCFTGPRIYLHSTIMSFLENGSSTHQFRALSF